jgi:hypothetical protein
MNYVSYFSPVIKPGKRRRFFAALTKGFELGGPSRETLTGHQSDSSSPPTKGKARRLLQPQGLPPPKSTGTRDDV